MAKRWCAFSARAREDGASHYHDYAAAGLVLSVALGVAAMPCHVPSARAETTYPTPSPGGAASNQLDTGFLLLPGKNLGFLKQQPAKVLVGDVLELKITDLAVGSSYRLELPKGAEPLHDLGWEVSEVNSRPGSPLQASAEGLPLHAIPLKSGAMTLPALAIVDGDKIVARTLPLTIQVESAIKKDDPKPQEPVGLRPPVDLNFPLILILLGVLLVLALTGLGIYAYRLWRGRRKPVVAPIPVEPPKPEDEVALTALASLEKEALWRKAQFKPHYFRTSEILKEYLGARYRFDALESTSREIINHLENRAALDRLVDRLESIFERLDRVKFTDHIPESGEPESVVSDAREIVMATRRVRVATEGGGGPAPGSTLAAPRGGVSRAP